MKFTIADSKDATLDKRTAVLVPGFEDGDERYACGISSGELTASIESGVITGKAEEAYYFPTPGAEYAGVLALGLGKFAEFDAERLRRAAGAACAVLQKNKITRVVLDNTTGVSIPIEAFIEGIMLGQYDFTAFKKEPDDAPVRVEEIEMLAASAEGADEIREGCERAIKVCDCTNWARDLANTPPTHMTARILAQQATEMAEKTGLDCIVFDEKALAEMGLNAFLGVARGSEEPPRLIVLKHSHPDAETTLALVGKGVTFDTGGISLKPGEGMHEMKFDMCGAAAVIGAMRAIAELNLPVNVVGVVPACDNKPGAGAQVPGDIVRAFNGKTIEIYNTDAEGRLLLADALAYAIKEYEPDAIVDAATLTGACVAALGHYAAGLFGNNDELEGDLELAAKASGDLVWPLPLWDDYTRLIKGTHGDLNNVGPKGEAGAITAAAFLKEFVGDTPWAHLDIAGTAWGGKHISYLDSNHATGFGVRLFTQWVTAVAAAQGD